VSIVWKFWSLNLQEPQGRVKACSGKAFLLYRTKTVLAIDPSLIPLSGAFYFYFVFILTHVCFRGINERKIPSFIDRMLKDLKFVLNMGLNSRKLSLCLKSTFSLFEV
jgi:hypothetical protein